MSFIKDVVGEKTANDPELSNCNEEKSTEEPNSKELSRGQSDHNQASNGASARLNMTDEEHLGEEALVRRIHGQTPSNFISSQVHRLLALFSSLTVKLCLVNSNHSEKYVGSGSLLNPHTWVHFSKLLQLYQLQGSNPSLTTKLLIKVNQNFLARDHNRQRALYEISFENFGGLEDFNLRCCSRGFYQFGECTFLEFKVHISLCEYFYSKYQELCALIQDIHEHFMERNAFFLIGHKKIVLRSRYILVVSET